MKLKIFSGLLAVLIGFFLAAGIAVADSTTSPGKSPDPAETKALF